MRFAVLMLPFAACASQLATLPASTPSEPGNVRIVDGKIAKKYATRSLPVTIPFGAGQNGNELVLALLTLAQRNQADFVSDLELAIVFKWKGIPIECTTRVVFPGDPLLTPPAEPPPPDSQPAAAADPVYETEVKDYQPRLVEYLATDQELFCEKRGEQVRVVHPEYESRFDVEVARVHAYIVNVSEITIVWHDVCEKRPVKHSVTRYDYEAKNSFVPVHWDYISKRFAEDKLSETQPLCYRVDAQDLGEPPVHRLRARMSYRGGVEQRVPLEGAGKPTPMDLRNPGPSGD